MNKKILLALLATASFSVSPLKASDDFGIWTDAGVTKRLGDAFSLSADLGFRANNKLKSVDRWDASVGLDLKILPFLKAGVGYTYMYSYTKTENENKYKSNGHWSGNNVTEPYWRSKNRFTGDLTGSFDIGRFSFSIRERYQLTHYAHTYATQLKYRYNEEVQTDGSTQYTLLDNYPTSEQDYKRSKDKNYLRSRFQVEYNIRHSAFTPYASVEMSNNMDSKMKNDKMRYEAGVDYKITRGQHISVGYCFQSGHDDDTDDNIHVIDINYSFKF